MAHPLLSSAQLSSALRAPLSTARRAAAALERRRRMGPYRGYVDGISPDGMISGWVSERRSGRGQVQVGLYAGEHLIDAGPANILREDVRAATGGSVDCGFQFVLTPGLMDQIAITGGTLSVRTMGPAPHVIGTVPLKTEGLVLPPEGADDTTRLAFILREDLAALERLLAGLGDAPGTDPAPDPVVPAPFERHGAMFSTEQVMPDLPESGHPAYLDYVRYRYRMDERYAVEPGMEESDRYLYWYLTAYRSQERRRVPLSAGLIDYLNAPLVMGGQAFALSRIMWWRLTGRPDLVTGFNLGDRDGYLDALFWWAHLDAPHLYFEDCLVPARYADLLRGIHPSRRSDPYPLSYFTERFFRASPQLHFLKPGTEDGRRDLALTMLVMAARRPDLLRYMPRRIVDDLLTPGAEGTCPLGAFVDRLRAATPTPVEDPVPVTPARYTRALRGVDFDLDSYAFLTVAPSGDRFEAAAMPRPDAGEVVDVQLIGPLAKASGLGQATRLSADVLRATGLSVRGVDFDLDNPAPEGFSSDSLIEDYGPARINLIHLNAESTPLAFAYQPDVFSGRYNIGYFFWELDRPAYCHYLGMEMLDEIWVSTEYGVQIYQPDADGKPVVNVGMCYEEVEGIDRRGARDFVNRRFRLNDGHYVCLVAFDSFSFVQRKNPVAVLQAFQKAFEGVPEARLIVKTQNRDSVFDPVQVQLWDRVEAIISGDSRIVVMNETLSYRDLLRLKAGSDCYVSLHKSEGWGFGMIEAMNLGVPVVCTAYSGNMDFCTPETAWLVDYEERLLEKGDYIFVRRGSAWAEPSVAHAAAQLRACYDNPDERRTKADAALAFIRKNFSRDAIAARYGDRLREILETGTT